MDRVTASRCFSDELHHLFLLLQGYLRLALSGVGVSVGASSSEVGGDWLSCCCCCWVTWLRSRRIRVCRVPVVVSWASANFRRMASALKFRAPSQAGTGATARRPRAGRLAGPGLGLAPPFGASLGVGLLIALWPGLPPRPRPRPRPCPLMCERVASCSRTRGKRLSYYCCGSKSFYLYYNQTLKNVCQKL